MYIDKKDISYRKASLDEVSLLVEYRIRFLKELQGEQTEKNEINLRKQLTDYFYSALEAGLFIAVIAEYNKRPIGFGGMVVQKIPGNFDLIDGKEGYILNMYTIPAFRRNGICSELLQHLVEEGKKLGLKKFFLHASADGIELYKRFGFSDPGLPELELVF